MLIDVSSISFWLSGWMRRLPCKCLWSSWIYVPPTEAFSPLLPNFHPYTLKSSIWSRPEARLTPLRPQPPSTLGLSPSKAGDDILEVKLWLQRSEGYCGTGGSGQAYIKVIPSASALVIKALEKSSRDRKMWKKNISTVEMSYLMRLSTLYNLMYNGYDTGLQPENTVQLLKEILGSLRSVGCNVDKHQP